MLEHTSTTWYLRLSILVYASFVFLFHRPLHSAIPQMANDHPWFANVSVQDAAVWTWSFFEQTDVTQAQALPNNPTMYIAETGWPSVRFSLRNC
jgi:hypothetical protein